MTMAADPVFGVTPITTNPEWLIDGADLLSEPDPGPTPWLVQDLIVDKAIIAAVGRWKTTKSYGLLDLCISIATGEPAFGHLEIPNPGPVIFVNEESGRAALWRRLDALCRGRGIRPERLRGQLLIAANARIKLDEPQWQTDLIELGQRLQPRLYVFDPLARMKAPAREENDQGDMAVLIEYIRLLRDETKAAVSFVHHTGHAGEHMRGTSDLESAWETRIRWKRDGQSPLVTLEAEHREAEAPEPITYRIAWDVPTRSMLFRHEPKDGDNLPPLDQRVTEWLTSNPNQKAEDIAKGLQIRISDIRNTLKRLEQAGTTHNGPSGARDAMGRPIRDKVWNLTSQAAHQLTMARPGNGTDQDDPPPGHRGSVARPVSLETGGTAEPPDEPHEEHA
jgi:hypothetical protein